ncbi:protein ORF35 [Cyprinid herpesvirus 1]|uniref:Protein ORF35 n=1 Tax=Cyprinid herpesvirus 1 TaxID=317858 RepID=K7PBC5_9VIRU|nr:protein ORF35 [Cyprinid herpesvirus 1]AFJ20339.1 protein ORF35 [Cyprinid herpesvirus 1]
MACKRTLFDRFQPSSRDREPTVRALKSALSRPPPPVDDRHRRLLHGLGIDMMSIGLALLSGTEAKRESVMARLSEGNVDLTALASYCGQPDPDLFISLSSWEVFSMQKRLGHSMVHAAYEIIRCSHNEVEGAVRAQWARLRSLFTVSRVRPAFYYTLAFYGQQDILLHFRGSADGLHDVYYKLCCPELPTSDDA